MMKSLLKTPAKTLAIALSLACFSVSLQADEKSLTKERTDQQPSNPKIAIKAIVLMGKAENLDMQPREGIEVEGIEVPGTMQDLQIALNPYLGKPLTKETIVEIKRHVIAYYQKHKHPLVVVEVPEQDISKGILRLSIIESRVGKVNYLGNRWVSDQRLRNRLKIQSGDEIDTEKLLNNLAFFNLNPFHHTDAIFKPGERKETTDIDFITKDRFPLRPYVGADNTGNEFTGFPRYFAGINWGDALFVGDMLTYQFTSGPEARKFYSHFAHYTSFLPWQHKLILFGGYTHVHPHIHNFKLKGHSAQASLRYAIPIKPLYRSVLQEFNFGFDFKDTDNNFEFTSAKSEVSVVKKTVNLGQFMASFALGDVFKHHEFSMNMEVYGSPGAWFPHSSNKNFRELRHHAKNHYLYGRLTLEEIYKLPGILSVAGLLRAQGATNTLLPSEQFGLGGYDTVRGYQERIFNADNAVCVNLELRSAGINLFEKLPINKMKSIKNELIFLVFADYGHGHNWHHLNDEKQNEFLVGVGPGLRLAINPYLSIRADYGFRLHKIQFNKNDSIGRAHVGIVASY